jgi:putative chitinase
MGNGNEASGEGYAFRGRGYIQLTGKQNYGYLSGFIGEDTVATPDLVASKYPLVSATFFFDTNSPWTICDQGSSDDTVKKVSQRVNGTNGVPNGLDDRLSRFKAYYGALV